MGTQGTQLHKFNNFGEIAGFIWQVADLLRGDYKQADYGKVILPLTVLRRLDCVLEPTKAKVLKKREALKKTDLKNLDIILNRITGVPFHNTQMGRRFIEHTMPEMVRQLTRLCDLLEKLVEQQPKPDKDQD